MTRIHPIDPAQAAPKAKDLLAQAEKKMGRVPNILKGLAHSPAALESYLSLSGILGGGSLSPQLREQIALGTAAFNSCGYCASAHTAIGKSLGIDADELKRNLQNESDDPRTRATLAFVQGVLASRGKIQDSELGAIRAAGFTDAEITEVVANISLNVLTNFFNGVADTENDFPPIELEAVVAG